MSLFAVGFFAGVVATLLLLMAGRLIDTGLRRPG